MGSSALWKIVRPSNRAVCIVRTAVIGASRSEWPLVFRGTTLQGIAARRFDDAEILNAAGRLLRAVLRHHLGGKELQSRKVLREMHRGRIARSEGPERGE